MWNQQRMPEYSITISGWKNSKVVLDMSLIAIITFDFPERKRKEYWIAKIWEWFFWNLVYAIFECKFWNQFHHPIKSILDFIWNNDHTS